MTERNLLNKPILRKLLVSRWPQFLVRTVAVLVFALTIAGGFIGTPVGSRNISIVLIWIFWWGLLILFSVPVLGRSWCSICPIPLTGEWIQQGTLLGPNPKARGIGGKRPWPKKWRNIWIQNGFFLGLAVFSTLILTNPLVTSIAILALLIMSIGISLVFERRSFCRYVCPVSGFIGLYSQAAPVEIRVVNREICKNHDQKTCYTGNEQGYGCPWGLYSAAVTRNVNCGLCMECLRTCPYENMAFNLRMPGKDLMDARGRGLDEAYKSFIMLGSALVYTAVMLGPWGKIKMATYAIGSPQWGLFVFVLASFVLVVLPGVINYGLKLIHPQISKQAQKRLFIDHSSALVPLGLAAWIAFSLSFIFTNFSYVLMTISDPFGWGWDIFGSANAAWLPYLSAYLPPVEALVLLVGLALTIQAAKKIAAAHQNAFSAVPAVVLGTLYTLGYIWILIG